MPENGKIKRYRRLAGWDYAKGASRQNRTWCDGAFAAGREGEGGAGGNPAAQSGDHAFRPGGDAGSHPFHCALVPGLREPLKVLRNAIRQFKNYTTKLARLAILAEHSSAINAGGGGPRSTGDGFYDGGWHGKI